MTISYGIQKLVNSSFDDTSGITNNGYATFESVGGALHLVGTTGNDARISMASPNLVLNGLVGLRGQFEVLSGVFRFRLSNGAAGDTEVREIFRTGRHFWNLSMPVVFRRTLDSGATLVIEALAANSEISIDFLTINDILSGGHYMPSKAVYSYIDFDGDTRQFSVPIVNADGASHDARLTEVEALESAIDGISKLNRVRTDFVIDVDETAGTKPSDQAAQVNIEWKVTYVDDVTGAVETMRIGGADLTIAGILQPSSNVANLANTEMAAFVTAFEAVVLSDAGNAVTVQSVAFLE